MSRSVAQKMGIAEGARALYFNAPAPALNAIGLPNLDVSVDLDGDFDCIHLFSITQSEMGEIFPKLKLQLKDSGMLWLSWPKGSKLGSDLSLPKVSEIGYADTWAGGKHLPADRRHVTGLTFTHPKRGKVYVNRYGTLPGRCGRSGSPIIPP